MIQNFHEGIDTLMKRATALNGALFGERTITDADGKQITKPLGECVLNALKAIRENNDFSAGIELIKKAHAGDKDAQFALNELRVEQSNNYILASMNFGLFFRVVNLGDADRPVYQNNTTQEVSVGYVGQDGKNRMVKAVKPQEETLIDLKPLESESFGYRLQDIYNGQIGNAALATVNIAYDLTNKVDALAYALYAAGFASGGAFGTFTITGNKASRVYLPNSRVLTANLPTTNALELSDNTTTGATSKFRVAVIRAIMKYCDQWANAFPSGPLRPTGKIIVPSIDATQIADEFLPTGSTSNPTADKLINSYNSFDYMGVNWLLVPDNTIATGTCFVQLNRPVGTIYTKTSQDEEFVETNRRKNWEERSQKKVVGFFINSHDRVNALKVTYKSAS